MASFGAKASWTSTVMDPVWLQTYLSWIDQHPVKYTWYLLAAAAVPVVSLQIVSVVVQSVVSRHLGSVGLAVFEAIRSGAGWLEGLQTSLWYVQTSRVSFLEGAGRLSEAGGMIVLGAVWTLASGALLMTACFLMASPLMDVLSPVEVVVAGSNQVNVVKAIGLDAFHIYALHIPAQVAVSNFLGISQGMRVIFRTLIPYVVCSLVSRLSIMHLAGEVPCGEDELAAKAAAEEANVTYQPFSRPCEEAKVFLVTSAAVTVVVQWVSVGCMAITCFAIAGRRGFFDQHGHSVCKYWRLAKAGGLFGRDFLERLSSVSLRSVVNNSRGILSLGAAIRMGTVEAAVFILADSIGELTYVLPNALSSGAMMIATRCYGKGDKDSALKIIYMFLVMTAVWAPLAMVITAAFETVAPAVWVGETERAEFQEKAKVPFYLVIAQQPLRALVGTYGPMLMVVQYHRLWGPIVVAGFCLVWLPVYVAAVTLGRISLLVAANCSYDVVHLTALVYFVHLRGIPALKQGYLSERSAPEVNESAEASAQADAEAHCSHDQPGSGQVAEPSNSRPPTPEWRSASSGKVAGAPGEPDHDDGHAAPVSG